MMTDREMLHQEDSPRNNHNDELIFQANSRPEANNNPDRYEDDGESQEFSDTENEHEHYSVPNQIVQRTFQEADLDNLSLESCQARRDRSKQYSIDIRKTSKTNTRK